MAGLKATVMDGDQVTRALKRIAHEILERNAGSKGLLFAGIKRGGVPLAEILSDNIYEIEGQRIPVGTIDIRSHRDDRDGLLDPAINHSDIPFDVTGKRVIMVDDVLCTGRTARAAMEALISFGRPDSIQLAVLIDRGHRELPIRGDYVGKNIPTSKNETVRVLMPPYDSSAAVELYEK